MTNEEYGSKLYNKIILIQKNKNITTTKIADYLGVSVQTASHRITAIKKGKIISLEILRALEEISGDRIICS